MTISLPRALDPHEAIELSNWYMHHQGRSIDELLDGDCTPPQAFVIDDYMTGSPGYVGPVYFAVWDGSPDFVDVFTVDRSDHCGRCGERADFHRDVELHEFVEKFRPLRARLRLVVSGAEYSARATQLEEQLESVCDWLAAVIPQLGSTSREEAVTRLAEARETLTRSPRVVGQRPETAA